MRHNRRSTRGLRGFTLIELLVVVAIIALLISILLPSLQRARKQAQAVACASNLSQVMLALRMYQDDHRGWLPVSYCPESIYGDKVGSTWSEAAWGVAKKNLWFYKLTPRYLGNPKTLVCPGDPFGTQFDYEARDDLGAPACGYGLNYVMRHWGTHLMNIDHRSPMWLPKTILLAEVGPDHAQEMAPLYGNVNSGDLAFPWRDGGRTLWNDGIRPWYAGPTWLTARHLGSINMSSCDGAVHRVPTLQQLREGPKFRDPECYGLNFATRTYVCPLCYINASDSYHYQFHRSQLWWWTGEFPRP